MNNLKNKVAVITPEEQLIGSIPLSRLGNAYEVADLIAFLSGDGSTFITGSNFLIDGGQSI